MAESPGYTSRILTKNRFRWVACQLDALEMHYTEDGVRKALNSLPTTLNETYKRILDSIPDTCRQDSIRILQFLAYSERPLDVSEVVDILAVTPENERSFNKGNRLLLPEKIVNYCSSLVTLTNDKTTIHLAHFSVKEYLTSFEDKEAFTTSFNQITAHKAIVEIIIAYLTYLPRSMNDHIRYITREFPFAAYCARYWTRHVDHVEKDSVAARAQLLKFFLDDAAWSLCFSIYNSDGTVGYGLDPTISDDSPKPLYIASQRGWIRSVENLLQHNVDLNFDSGRDGTALRAACQGGHYEIVVLLIEKGADVKMLSGPLGYRSVALMAACEQGHGNVVEVLLDHGAQINMQVSGTSFFSDTPLIAACGNGHQEVAQLLLDRGVDVNLPGFFSTPLTAAGLAHKDLIRLLLEHGADAEQTDGSGDNLFSLCQSCGKYDILRMILGIGDDDNTNMANGVAVSY